MVNLLKRIKLLFLREELVNFILEIDNEFEEVEEYCKKKEWKIYDNIHNQLNLIENNKKQKVRDTTIKTPAFTQDYFQERAVNIVLKIYFLLYKNNG